MTYSGMGKVRGFFLFAVWGPLLALGAAGCGEDIEVSSDPPRERAASEIAASFCAAAEPCCASLKLPEPGPDCEREIRTQVMIAIIEAEDSERQVVPGAIDSCAEAFALAATGASACHALPSTRDIETICPNLFSAAPEGSLLPGAPCDSVADCASPTEPGARSCVRLGFQPAGICQWALQRGADAACENDPNVASCQQGLTCAPTPEGLVCAAPPYGNDACVPGVTECAPGYDCLTENSESLCVQTEGIECDAFSMPCSGSLVCSNGYCIKPPATCEGDLCPSPAFDRICK